MIDDLELNDKVRSYSNKSTVYTVLAFDDIYVTVSPDSGEIYRDFYRKDFYLDKKSYRDKIINNILL